MSRRSLDSFIEVALREFRLPPCDAPAAVRRRQHLRSDGPASGVFDLHKVRRTIHYYHRTAVSRAVHQLVRLRVLEPMMPTGGEFIPAEGRLGQVGFVGRRESLALVTSVLPMRP
jgi:hypothetical protein